MRRHTRHDLQRRLARVEGHRRDGMCICDDPIRVAWKSTTVVEHECDVCGGELLVVRLGFDEDLSPAAKAARTATFRKIIPKAEPKIVDREGPKINLEKLTDDELSDLRDAMTPPGEKRRTRRKATRPAQKPQQTQASAPKRKTPSPAPRSAPRSDPPSLPVDPKSEHGAEGANEAGAQRPAFREGLGIPAQPAPCHPQPRDHRARLLSA